LWLREERRGKRAAARGKPKEEKLISRCADNRSLGDRDAEYILGDTDQEELLLNQLVRGKK